MADDPKGQSQGQPGKADPAQGTPPAWTLPEKFKTAEDLYKSYTELEHKLGELGPRAKVAEQVDQLGGWDTVSRWANYGYQNWQESQKAKPQGQAAPAGHQADTYANWEYMTPQQQAQTLQAQTQTAAQAYLDQLVTQRAQTYAEQFQQAIGNMNRQWEIYQTAQELRDSNPELRKVPMKKLMESALKVATMQPDSLLEMAAKSLTGEADQEARVQALVAQRLADLKQAETNQGMAVLTNPSRSPFQLPETPKTRGEENALIAKKLLESGLTPAHF